VDGGINFETAPQAIKAGVDILVAGSSVFGEVLYLVLWKEKLQYYTEIVVRIEV